MSAPVATLPTPENDSRPARPVYFQTPTSAQAHAIKRAMAESADGMAHPVEFVDFVFRGGERFFAAEPAAPSDDYVVREVPAAEVTRRQQAGIRNAVERCLTKARAHDLAAGIAKPGSCFERIHKEQAKAERHVARELELRLTVSAAPRSPVASEWSDEDKFYGRHIPGARLEGAE